MSKFTHTKLKAFKTGSMNIVSQPNKKDDNQKKKIEEEETAQVYQEFIETFQETSKVNKAWVKGGTVMPGTTGDVVAQDSESNRVYKPSVKYGERSSEKRSDRDKDDERRHGMKPYLASKKKDEKKKSNLEIFKEELKAIQEQRQFRHDQRRKDSSRDSERRSRSPDRHHQDVESSSHRSMPSESSSSRRASRFDTTNVPPPTGRSLLGGIAPPSDVDYPYDYEGDKSTTNLFLGNLNPAMTETQLCELFGHFGPLASVKVMWPRTEEERARGRNCGFVAFMSRQDGEKALSFLKGREILNFEMKLGWGKNVAIPAHPIYVPPALMEMIKPPPPSNLPFNAQPREWLQSVKSKIKERLAGSRSRGLLSRGEDAESTIERKPFNIDSLSKDELDQILVESVVKVVIPTDRTLLALINRMVEFVCREGPIFEAMIMNREINNPMFKFLFDYQSPEHVYYRWRLFSILHGDSGQRWRTEEFRMYVNGPVWRPPPMDIYTSGMPEGLVEENDFPYQTGLGSSHKSDDKIELEENISQQEPETEQSRRTGLSDSQREKFDEMLRELEPERQKIGEVMCWCLEHAEFAEDITDMIAKSISISQSVSLNRKIARLFLASDILFNSSAKVPKASYFRRSFESRLMGIFKDLNEYLNSFESRMKAEQFKQKVMLSFRAWEDWAVYPNDFLIKLQNIFLGLNRNREGSSSRSPGGGGSANQSDEEEVDGKPLVDYDGDPIDIDGAPLDNGDDLDGEPLFEEDSKSKKAAGTEKSSGSGHLFIPSKWETVDPDAEEEERLAVAVATSSKWEQEQPSDDDGGGLGVADRSSRPDFGGRDDDDEDDIAGDRSFKEDGEIDDDVDGKPLVAYGDDESSPYTARSALSNSDSALMNEKRRSKLREIEVKVMKYQDELESGRKGSKSSIGNISQLVERYRQKLLDEIGESNSSSPKRHKHSDRDSRESSSSRLDKKKSNESKSRKKSSRSSSRSRSRSHSHERRSLKSTISSSRTISDRSPNPKKKSSGRSSKERRRSRSTERISSEIRKPRRSRSRSRSPQSSSKSKYKSKSKK